MKKGNNAPAQKLSHQDESFANGIQSNMKHNGLEGAITGYGTAGQGSQLSQTDTLYQNARFYLISNMRPILSQMYVEHGIVQTIVDVPVDDGMRGGVEIKTSQLSPDELEKLNMAMEENDDIGTFGQALKWNRLFGGAGVVIITGQDPEEELNMDELEDDLLEFRAVDMWELFWSKQNTEDYASVIDGKDQEPEFFNYYGKKLHKSRVIMMKGLVAPSFIRPRLRGWGFSVIEALVRSINQYLKSTDLAFEVLDEFKLDIFKIDGLAQILLRADGESLVQRRIALANYQKNYQNALSMDAKDSYEQKQLSFSGLAEVGQGIRMQIASDLRMPLTKIFGISSAGFSSGEDDIENYNSMVESTIRQKYKFGLLKLIKVRCANMFGFVPDDLVINFKSLRVLPADMEETVKTQKFSRLLQARQAGEISSKEFKEGCNKDELFPIQIDESQDTLTSGKEGEGEGVKGEKASGEAGSKIGPKSAPSAPSGKKANSLKGVDPTRWEMAKEKCIQERGSIHWKVVNSIYLKLGELNEQV